MYKELLDQINDYKNISIFRHYRPDGDCIFASLAIKEFIKINFKDKRVKLVGNDVFDLYPTTNKVSDSFIRNSLAIIVDVNIEERVDDDRFKIAQKRIVIDHHPIFKKCEGFEIVYDDPKSCAACELLGHILYSKEYRKYQISKKCAKYILSGILTDSLSFKTASTTSRTLALASKLVKDFELNLSELNDFVFAKDLHYFNCVTKIRNKLHMSNGVGYVILSKNDLEKIGIAFEQAKNCIDDFANIKDLKIWTIFAYNPKTGLYDGSIRSRREYVINEIANRYNGGGHKNACGVKKLTYNNVKNLIKKLEELLLVK